MIVTLSLEPEFEARLRSEASRQGTAVEALIRSWVVERINGSVFDREEHLAIRLARMHPRDRDTILAEAAERAAVLYEADMARSPDEREPTALLDLDEPIHGD